jgi:hypothetical protein
MMKPGKTFNLSKQTKRFMATFTKAEDRNHYKRMMIDAQLCSEVVIKTPSRDNKRPQSTSNYVTNDTGTASTQA